MTRSSPSCCRIRSIASGDIGPAGGALPSDFILPPARSYSYRVSPETNVSFLPSADTVARSSRSVPASIGFLPASESAAASAAWSNSGAFSRFAGSTFQYRLPDGVRAAYQNVSVLPIQLAETDASWTCWATNSRLNFWASG